MPRTAFRGDAAWANFIAVGPEDLERALRGRPEPVPAACRTLDDMTEQEIHDIERLYGCRVRKRHKF